MSVPTLGVLGATGRMGRAVVRLAYEGGHRLVCALSLASSPDVGRDAGELAGIGPLGVLVGVDLASIAKTKPDVLIDFSSPAAVCDAAGIAASAGVAIVSGTTGLDAAATRALDLAAERVPVLWEPNMSVGVHVLAELVGEAVRRLGPSFDIEIVETHHGLKADAPSGTALRLAEAARNARRGSELVYGRHGRPGARPPSEIGVHAVRGGDVIGDHEVHLLGKGERVELTHKATSRDVFAHGALRAACYVATRQAGRYALQDVLR